MEELNFNYKKWFENATPEIKQKYLVISKLIGKSPEWIYQEFQRGINSDSELWDLLKEHNWDE